jgi:hypothetical protein
MKFAFYILLLFNIVSFALASNQQNFGRVAVKPELIVPGANIRIEYNNPKLIKTSVFIHYGFNGWNLPLSGTGAGSAIDQNNKNYYMHSQMIWDEKNELYYVRIFVPTDARALHMSFCWDSCHNGQWDNNEKNDYAWPIVFPYIGPILTWNEKTPPSSGIVISFESGQPAVAWLEYGMSGVQKPKIKIMSPIGVGHRFELKSLLPDTFYSYRVGSGKSFKSAEFKFKTAKSFTNLKNLSFLVFGDAQDNGEDGVFSKLAKDMAVRHSDIDFVLSTGDLPWNDNPGDWWTYFDKGRTLFARHVVMPTIGNHDTPTVNSSPDHRSFVRYFDLPYVTKERVFYQFNFATAHFYALNSERPNEMAEGGIQYMWLDSQLKKRDFQIHKSEGELWSFAYWHIPPFNVGARHGSQQIISRDLASLFDGVIDWHFGGHEHLYQRTKPLKFFSPQRDPIIMESYGNRKNDGVGYLVVPSSGVAGSSELFPYSSHPEHRKRLAFPAVNNSVNNISPMIGYTRVDIVDSAIILQVFRLNENTQSSFVIDQVHYQK